MIPPSPATERGLVLFTRVSPAQSKLFEASMNVEMKGWTAGRREGGRGRERGGEREGMRPRGGALRGAAAHPPEFQSLSFSLSRPHVPHLWGGMSRHSSDRTGGPEGPNVPTRS